jgi:hypothetical protein
LQRKLNIETTFRYCDAPGCEWPAVLIVSGGGFEVDLCWSHYEEAERFTAERLGIVVSNARTGGRRAQRRLINLNASDALAWLEGGAK